MHRADGAYSPIYGESGYERVEGDFYATEYDCTEAFLQAVKLRGPVWECACGENHIVKVLRAYDYEVVATDIVDRGFEKDWSDEAGIDFLHTTRSRCFAPSIMTNPPYDCESGTAEQFIAHALSLTKEHKGQVAMFLRHEYDCAVSRRYLFGEHEAFDSKYVLNWRPRFFDTAKGGGRHWFAWYLWDWAREPGPPQLHYLTRPQHRVMA